MNKGIENHANVLEAREITLVRKGLLRHAVALLPAYVWFYVDSKIGVAHWTDNNPMLLRLN